MFFWGERTRGWALYIMLLSCKCIPGIYLLFLSWFFLDGCIFSLLYISRLIDKTLFGVIFGFLFGFPFGVVFGVTRQVCRPGRFRVVIRFEGGSSYGMID